MESHHIYKYMYILILIILLKLYILKYLELSVERAYVFIDELVEQFFLNFIILVVINLKYKKRKKIVLIFPSFLY